MTSVNKLVNIDNRLTSVLYFTEVDLIRRQMQDSRWGTRNFKNRAFIGLPDLDNRLIAYALVAGAALAAVPAANASVVYVPVNQTVSSVNAPLDFFVVNGVPQFSLEIRSFNSGGTQVRGAGVQG